jgi:deoxycytidylate deaminase
MELLSPQKNPDFAHWFDEAERAARDATCLRAKCGTVVVTDGEIIGEGFNSPPGDLESQRRCLIKDEVHPKFKSDKTCCVHAEQRAIMEAFARHPDKIKNAALYFIRLDDTGKKKFSGKPYCTHCSKLALDAGIGTFALWHEKGMGIYETEEYNLLSYKYDGEPLN